MNVFDYLVPQDDKPETMRLWRIRIALVACGTFFIVTGFVLPAMITGLPKLGSVAWASDIQGLKNDVNDIKIQLLSQSILAANQQKCEQEKDGKFSSYWQEQLSKLKREYWLMTGQSFELPPSC
jgi:hypothetical protein